MSGSPLSKRFGAAVRSRRLRKEMSQETLAELAQLHPTYVSMVERGVRNPTLDVADRIAKALETTLSKLIDEADRKPRR
jgi:transcriptional regulator with XRE-family HTH domain